MGHEARVGTDHLPRSIAGEVAADDQQPIEVEQRIGQQRVSDAGQDLLDRFRRPGFVAGQPLQQGGALEFESRYGLPVLHAVVLAGKLRLHVLDGQPHGFQVDALKCRDLRLDLRPPEGALHPLGPLLRRRPRQSPTFGKGHGRLQSQPADVRKRAFTAELDDLPAPGDGQPALLLPPGRRGVPASRDPVETGVHDLLIEANLDRTRLGRRVEGRQRVLGADGEFDFILDPIRQLAGVPDTGGTVGIRLASKAHPDVAAVEVRGLDRKFRAGGSCPERQCRDSADQHHAQPARLDRRLPPCRQGPV